MRWLELAAIVALAPALVGCHFPVKHQEVVYHPEAPPEPARAAARNELVAGILPVRVCDLDGADADEDAARAKEAGRAIADAIDEARIFREVRYPLRDEKVDVVLEPVLTVTIAKNRFRNAMTVFPGIVLPWIDGFGLRYDHTAVLEMIVRPGRAATLSATSTATPSERGATVPVAITATSLALSQDAVCDRHVARSQMSVERYPSVLWWLGLHAGLFILLVFESATTDEAVLERLVDRDCAAATGEDCAWLSAQFAPTAKACPVHPDAPKGGRFCIYCGRDTWYPILDRREGVAIGVPEPASRAPASVTRTAR